MAITPDKSYIYDPELIGEDSVAFACSTDVKAWPWLALPPHNPGAINAQSFWTSIGASRARNTMDEDKWSALTWTRWECGDDYAAHAVRGTYDGGRSDGRISFTTTLYDVHDRLVVKVLGKGVIFQNRDFESWRAKAKQQAEMVPDLSDFDFAQHGKLGLTDGEHPFVSPLTGADGRSLQGLITKENGLMPGNRYFGGSGDHVNSTHLAELSRQALSLLHDGVNVKVTGGEMTMHRYVELGSIIDVTVSNRDAEKIELKFAQAGHDCTSVSLQFRQD
ncbi:MAG: hypothetical protein ABJ239_06560 [Erythrobacter sp.]